MLFLEITVEPDQALLALQALRDLKAKLEARMDVRGAQLLRNNQQPNVILLESKWSKKPPAQISGWPTPLEAKHRAWTFEVLEGAAIAETLTNWRRSRFEIPQNRFMQAGTTSIKLEGLRREEYPQAVAASPRTHVQTGANSTSALQQALQPVPHSSLGLGFSRERTIMQPQKPMQVLRESTLMAMAEDLNSNQGVAVALLPRFGLEITIEGNQFQVNVAELQTGHDIRLSRDVAAGISEAMKQLVDKIDAHLASEAKPSGSA